MGLNASFETYKTGFGWFCSPYRQQEKYPSRKNHAVFAFCLDGGNGAFRVSIRASVKSLCWATTELVCGELRKYFPALTLRQRSEHNVEPCRQCDVIVVAQFPAAQMVRAAPAPPAVQVSAIAGAPAAASVAGALADSDSPACRKATDGLNG
jgi:hypothetical protein